MHAFHCFACRVSSACWYSQCDVPPFKLKHCCGTVQVTIVTAIVCHSYTQSRWIYISVFFLFLSQAITDQTQSVLNSYIHVYTHTHTLTTCPTYKLNQCPVTVSTVTHRWHVCGTPWSSPVGCCTGTPYTFHTSWWSCSFWMGCRCSGHQDGFPCICCIALCRRHRCGSPLHPSVASGLCSQDGGLLRSFHFVAGQFAALP